MLKIAKEDLVQITYQEFGEMVERLTEKIKQYAAAHEIEFDLLVPILRGGGFTGMHIASRLGIKNILPVQYKYIFKPLEFSVKKFELPELTYRLEKKANILIVDSKTVYGGTAKKVIHDIITEFPHANLFFVSLDLDQSLSSFEHVQHIFSERLSNERRLLSVEQAATRGIAWEVIVFPWEDVDDMWQEITNSDKYNNG